MGKKSKYEKSLKKGWAREARKAVEQTPEEKRLFPYGRVGKDSVLRDQSGRVLVDIRTERYFRKKKKK